MPSLVAVAIAFAGSSFLRVAIDPRAPEPDRLNEQPGVNLGIDRARDHALDGRPDYHIAMAAHERDRAIAKRLGQRLAAYRVGDEEAARARDPAHLEHRHIGGEEAR